MTEPARRAQPAQAAVRRRLPGRARDRKEVLHEYQELNAERRSRIPSVLWQFWAPNPDELHRWRVELDCGCVEEVLTTGDTPLPTERQWRDHLGGGLLPVGQMLCRHDNAPPAPYRDITEWGDRREVRFSADPAEPPDWADAQTWAVIRRDKPGTSAFWTVTLSCGHLTEVVTGLEWKPADGPTVVSAERLRKMRAEFEDFWASDPEGHDDHERAHTERMLAEGWPRPQPEHQCNTCPHARRIVAYQPVGWLVPRKAEPRPQVPPSRRAIERRLHQAEAEADRLRQQLAQLD